MFLFRHKEQYNSKKPQMDEPKVDDSAAPEAPELGTLLPH